ncbi:MAG: DUF2156 domain-containing protein [Lachnospiraceae bacterium]|nr:DUF2156 domain-containing protein [Lachnospiraceae bacterium]MCI9306841.1 DUF2156 domain-containing protein [Lachnospiraceae bacterium]
MMEINLKRPKLEDRALINDYLKYADTRSCEMTFANTYLWSRHYDVGFAIVEDMLVFGRTAGDVSFTVPVGPGGEERLKQALDTLMRYCEEQEVPFQLHNVTKEDFDRLEALYPGQFFISYEREYADYVYETEKLAKLSGKKYHSKKNHANKFKALYPDWSYEPITKDNVEECFQMALRWRELNGCEEDEEKHAEICVTLNYLRLFEELNMRGGALRVNGEIVAFTVGEPVGKDTLVVHIEKAFADIQGAYTMINQQFAEHEGAGFTYLNREEDMGEEGLRQAKMSYKPVFLVEKGVVRKRSVL